MEKVVEVIPASLMGDLSNKLVSIILGTKDKSAVPADLAKKVIYLWRQDQLASPTGVMTLLEAAVMADSRITYTTLDELGLQDVSATLKNLQIR